MKTRKLPKLLLAFLMVFAMAYAGSAIVFACTKYTTSYSSSENIFKKLEDQSSCCGEIDICMFGSELDECDGEGCLEDEQ